MNTIEGKTAAPSPLRRWARKFKAWPGKFQLVEFAIAIASLWFVFFQLRANNETNKVELRGQLYDRQMRLAADMGAGDAASTVWALSSQPVSTDQVAPTLLRLVTSDPNALKAKNADELYHCMFDLAVFADPSRNEPTKQLRSLFLYTQNTFYHVHNIFDYKHDGIVTEEEWKVWKGLLREMHGHPMFLTVIWQGHQNRYFSRRFARFLQTEICPDDLPSDVADIEAFKRDREFVRLFYPEMTKKDWPNALPDY